MAKFLSLLIKILVTIPVVAFLGFVSISNRSANLDIIWSPLHDSAVLSLPVIVFIAIVFGFVWGSLILWSNTLYLREERRALKKQVITLEKQLSAQRQDFERVIAQRNPVAPVADPQTVSRISAPELYQ